MNQRTTRVGRPPDRHNAIYAALVGRIVRGQIPPGGKLPTRREIAEEFAASSRTIQAVLDDLASAGFTVAQGVHGTFVNDNPPHLHKHALVFDSHGGANLYFTAVLNEARKLQEEGWALDFIDMPLHPDRQKVIADLTHAVSKQLYAGLLFVNMVDDLKGTEIFDSPDMPRVHLAGCLFNFHKTYQSITQEPDPFLDRAIDRALELGYRRPCFFTHMFEQERVDDLLKLCRRKGIEAQNSWVHTIHLNIPREAYVVTDLIFSLPKDKRPDCFIIANDNLTESVTRGVKDFGPAGGDFPIISLCNHPWLPTARVPVTWLGYDIREMLVRAIGLVESERRRGGRSDAKIFLQPRFEDELLG